MCVELCRDPKLFNLLKHLDIFFDKIVFVICCGKKLNSCFRFFFFEILCGPGYFLRFCVGDIALEIRLVRLHFLDLDCGIFK